jgi:hypothetical protein
VKRPNVDVPVLGDGWRRKIRPASRGLRKQDEIASGAKKFFRLFIWILGIALLSVFILSYAF